MEQGSLSEAEEIARFIAEHGVTRCPVAFAAETQAWLNKECSDLRKRTGKWVSPGGRNHRSITRFRRKALDIIRNSQS